MISIEVNNILKRQNKSKYWLVSEMDSSYSALKNVFEDNAVAIRLETIEKLCKVLACTPNDIFKIG